jgi:hypothetical protein
LNGDITGESLFFADPLVAAESDPKTRPDAPLGGDDAPLGGDDAPPVIEPRFNPVTPAEALFGLLPEAEAEACAPGLPSSPSPVVTSPAEPVPPPSPESEFTLEDGRFPLRL